MQAVAIVVSEGGGDEIGASAGRIRASQIILSSCEGVPENLRIFPKQVFQSRITFILGGRASSSRELFTGGSAKYSFSNRDDTRSTETFLRPRRRTNSTATSYRLPEPQTW